MAVYLVTREGAEEGEKPRMVDARYKASAINHVAGSMFSATPLSTREALTWAKQGIELEELGGE